MTSISSHNFTGSGVYCVWADRDGIACGGRRGDHDLRIDSIVYWVRSISAGGDKDRVPMYYKGRCDRADEGQIGYDIKCRPVSLGPGPCTATYGGADFERGDGSHL